MTMQSDTAVYSFQILKCICENVKENESQVDECAQTPEIQNMKIQIYLVNVLHKYFEVNAILNFKWILELEIDSLYIVFFLVVSRMF